MDVVADLPADAEPAEPVQQGQGLFDDPADLAESGAVFGATTGDDRFDTPVADLSAVAVVVLATVGVDLDGTSSWLAAFAADRGYGVQ